MKIIYRCLIKEILMVAAFVTGLLILIFVCVQLANFLSSPLASSLVSSALCQFIGLQIPLLLTELLPLGIFFAVLLVYGRWYADSEMVVLFSSGFSQQRLLIFTWCFALIISLFSAVLSFWIMPSVSSYQKQLITKMMAEFTMKKMVPQEFQTIGDVVYYIGDVSKNNQTMQNIFFFQPKDHGKVMLILAKHAQTQVSEKTDSSFIIANQGYRYELTPGKKDVFVTQYDTYAQQLTSVGTGVGDVNDTNIMSTRELLSKSNFFRGVSQYGAELQWRISLPIALVLLSLLAVPLSYVNPRHGRFSQLLPAILIAIIYVNLLYTFQNWVGSGVLPLWIGVWWIHFVLIILIVFLVNRWMKA
jgi:lipopolysaccharide export system permease protein